MKTCPVCGKKYDDSWSTCLSCRKDLVPDGQVQSDARFLDELSEEARDIKKTIEKLTDRLTLLELKISHKRQGSIAEKAEKGQPVQAFKPDVISETAKIATSQEKKKEPLAKIEPKSYSAIFKKPISEGVNKPSENFEQVLGGKWFNKLGILSLVIGISLFMGYALQYMGPALKALTGYLAGVALLATGWRMEKKEGFGNYAKTLIGGGWAVMYFVTYAIHHISSLKMIDSPLLGFFLLLLVAVAAVAHIYKYRSQAATAFSYLLFYLTLLTAPMSYYTLFSELVIAVSLLYFMYKEKWNEFTIYGIVMTYLTFLGTGTTPKSDNEFITGFVFLLLFWFIFIVACFFMKGRVKQDGQELPVEFRDIALLVNSAMASFVVWLMLGSGFMKFLQPVLMIGILLYLALTVVTFVLKQRSMYIINSTVAIIAASLFLSNKYSGYQATVAYMVLAEIILLSGIILKEVFWRVVSGLFLAVIFLKLLAIDSFMNGLLPASGTVNARTLLFAAAFFVYLGNYFLYRKMERVNALADYELKYKDVLSYAFPAIFMVGTWLDLPKVLTAPAWMIFGAVLLQLGINNNNRHQRIQGYILTMGAFLRLVMSNMVITGGVSFLSYRLMTCVPVIVLLYYCYLAVSEKRFSDIAVENEKNIRVPYAYLIFISIMFLIYYELPKSLVAAAWALTGIIYMSSAIKNERSGHNLLISSFAGISAFMHLTFVNILVPKYLVTGRINFSSILITLFVLYAGDILFLQTGKKITPENDNAGKIKKMLRDPALLLGALGTAAACALLFTLFSGVMLSVSLALFGLGLFLAGFIIKERNWRIYGLWILLFTIVKAFLIDLRQLGTLPYIFSLIMLGVMMLFVSYLYTKYKDKIKNIL